MAITTYQELQDAVSNWLDRSDLTTRIPEFISLAEGEMRRQLRSEAAFTPLSAVSATWVNLIAAPDMYLYGALKYAAPYLEHDERVPLWAEQFDKAIAQYNEYLRNKALGGPITTFAELVIAVDNYLGRYDLTARVPQFVNLCEGTLKRRLRRRGVRETITLTAASDTFDLTTLTTPCAEARSLQLLSAGSQFYPSIRIVTSVGLSEIRTWRTGNGVPRRAAVIGTDLILAPTPDAAYEGELFYFAKYVSITTNTAQLIESPDLYLYGSLLHAAPYLGQDQRVPLWGTQFEAALLELNVQRKNEELGASPKPINLPVVFG